MCLARGLGGAAACLCGSHGAEKAFGEVEKGAYFILKWWLGVVDHQCYFILESPRARVWARVVSRFVTLYYIASYEY